MEAAKEAANRLVNYFDNLGTEDESQEYDPAEDARTVKEAFEKL